MCDRRKLLLAAIVFFHKVIAGSANMLDMAPDAVDDRYVGCREEAMKKLIDGLLQQELHNSKGFQNAWNASISCPKNTEKANKHTTALYAYAADGDDAFKKTFDDQVETMGGNVSTYEDHFHFKSLHFLLMDSMTLQPPSECKTLYVLKEKYTAQEGSEVRFGSFTKALSSYSVLWEMEEFDGQVIFNITSCFFVNLGVNGCTEDGVVLLSPAEVFTVEEVNHIRDNDSAYTEIVLNQSKLMSSHNCYIFSRSPADVSTQWLVLMLLALPLFFFNC